MSTATSATSYFLDRFNATLLDVRTRQGRRLWRMNASLSYYSVLLGKIITVPAGYVTDLESCPRYPIVFWLVGDIVEEPAVVHDYCYSHALFPRVVCDKLLREASEAMGTPEWQANVLYLGVRVGGASHFGGSK